MTAMKLEVLLTPVEFATLRNRDLSQTVCVVLDILRATTSMVTALANGAEAIIPVAEISEALAIRQQRPEVLLAGEREGLRISPQLTGGVQFDLGNSPREYIAKTVQGKTIVLTTTNGTRALRACAGAKAVLVGSFLNLRATYLRLQELRAPNLVLVCSGTFDEPALEDILAAGAICERIWQLYAGGHTSDSAEVARRLYPLMQYDLLGAMKHSVNGRRLLANPELRNDVWFSVQRETLPFTAELCADGAVRKR